MIADGAARLRARHKLSMPDALITATAMVAGAAGLVTNDIVLKGQVDGLEVALLDR
jgi:predicted nucleic acid-binding protein